MATSRESAREGEPWPVIALRVVICAALAGVLFGVLTGSWMFGSMVAATVVGIPLACTTLSVLWGAIVIPPTMLAMRWLGAWSSMRGSRGARSPDKQAATTHIRPTR